MSSITNLIVVSLLLLMTVQSCFWIAAPPESTYANSWQKTGILFMHLFGLQPGPDRKLVLLALTLLPVCILGFMLLTSVIAKALS